MPEDTQNLFTFKITKDEKKWADGEQERLKSVWGQSKVTQDELFRAMREVYEREVLGKPEDQSGIAMIGTENRELAEAFIDWFRNPGPDTAPWRDALSMVLDARRKSEKTK